MSGKHSISVPSNSVGPSQGHQPGAVAQPTSLHKNDDDLYHVLNLDWRVFVVRKMVFDRSYTVCIRPEQMEGGKRTTN